MLLLASLSGLAADPTNAANTAREKAEQLRQRGMVEFTVRNWVGAESLFKAALALTPKYDRNGKVKAELEELLAVARLRIAEPWTECNRGDGWDCGTTGGMRAQAAGRTREALQYYLKAWEGRRACLAVSAASGWQDFYYYLGACYQDTKELLQTIADLARDVQPPLEIPEQAQIKFKEAIGEFKSATTPAQAMRVERTFLDAIDLAPFWVDAYRILGGVAKTAGDCRVEIGALEMFLRFSPEDAEANAARSDIAECRRRSDL
jgi:tetratricopeptide (TPR) repeat protein